MKLNFKRMLLGAYKGFDWVDAMIMFVIFGLVAAIAAGSHWAITTGVVVLLSAVAGLIDE